MQCTVGADADPARRKTRMSCERFFFSLVPGSPGWLEHSYAIFGPAGNPLAADGIVCASNTDTLHTLASGWDTKFCL